MFYPSLIGSNFGTSSYAMTTATQAENAAREAQTKLEIMKHDVDRLLLITEALWTFMKQEHGYTDDTLVQLIQDMEQQKAATGSTSVKDPPVTCPSCGRTNTATRPFCMYCGKPLQMKPFAR
jgi:hypothetical protein